MSASRYSSVKRSEAKLSPVWRDANEGKALLEGKLPGKMLYRDFLLSLWWLFFS